MFDSSIKFKYKWRPYQERILNDADRHLKDKKINIVASPGSGKTVLGLELIRRLDNPVLILSPTITIKNQWVDRFVLSFMPDKSKTPEWISTDIYNINKFNSITYQALHCAYKRIQKKEDNLETDDKVEEEKISVDADGIKSYDLIAELKKNNIKTIVLDEAHHLKKEWWTSLTKVIDALKDVVIISLTATPPYDIDYGEWKKYISLCGDIDEEISVPELVKARNLCPHQDYIYFSQPTSNEMLQIKEYEKSVENFINNLQNNQSFIELIMNYKYITQTYQYIEEILEIPSVYSSMLIFLNSAGIDIKKEKIKILGHQDEIPNLNSAWVEVLLQYVLFDKRKEFTNDELLNEISASLQKMGAIEKRKVLLKNNPDLKKNFVSSLSKLDSIRKIVDTEYSSLGKELRMVILTDYLRTEYLNNPDMEINKMGVFPIFIKLLDKKINIAILTGSTFMIPISKIDKLYKIAEEHKIAKEKIDVVKVNAIKEYCIVKTVKKYKNDLLKSITKLFEIGEVNIIIGTKSLLGEGWDEPSINSLILASFVGSYVLSNQMRGRAIRVSNDSNKTANIWHLVCVTSILRNFIYNEDYDMMKRRFNSFVGVGYSQDVIESGIERLDVPKTSIEFNIAKYNDKVIKLCTKRQEMAQKWFGLVDNFKDDTIHITNEAEAKDEKLISTMQLIDIKRTLADILLMTFLGFVDVQLQKAKINGNDNFLEIFIVGIIITVLINIALIIRCIKAIILSVPRNQLKVLVKVVCECLYEANLIDTMPSQIKVQIIDDKKNSSIQILFAGAKSQENTIIYNSLEEIFRKTENQRYILVNDKEIVTAYYNVPSIFSTNKKLAQIFYNNWRKYICRIKLVYTKSIEGRKVLLRARRSTFDYTNDDIFTGKKKKISRWS